MDRLLVVCGGIWCVPAIHAQEVYLKLAHTCPNMPAVGFQLSHGASRSPSTRSDKLGIAAWDLRDAQIGKLEIWPPAPRGCESFTIDAPQNPPTPVTSHRNEANPLPVVLAKQGIVRSFYDRVSGFLEVNFGARLGLPPCGCQSLPVSYLRLPSTLAWNPAAAGLSGAPQAPPAQSPASRAYLEGINLLLELRYQEAAERLEADSKASPTPQSYLALSLAAEGAGDLARAERGLRDGLAAFPAGSGDRKSRSRLLGALGHVLLARGRPEEALASARESLDIDRSIDGPESLAVANGHALEAEIRRAQGQYQAALDAAQQAMAIDQKRFVRETASVEDEATRNYARDAELLGLIQRDRGQYAEAARHLRSARDLDRKTHAEDPILGDTALALAVLLVDHGSRAELEQAREAAEEAVRNYTSYFGEEHTQVARAKYVLARIRLELGQGSAAAGLAQAALMVDRRAFGLGHPRAREDEELVRRVAVRKKVLGKKWIAILAAAGGAAAVALAVTQGQGDAAGGPILTPIGGSVGPPR